jgi:hypothetical protein
VGSVIISAYRWGHGGGRLIGMVRQMEKISQVCGERKEEEDRVVSYRSSSVRKDGVMEMSEPT